MNNYKNICKEWMTVLKQPIEGGRAFVLRKNLPVAGIIIGIQGLLTALLSLIFQLRLYGMIQSKVFQLFELNYRNSDNLLNSKAAFKQGMSMLGIPYIKGFFVALIFSLLLSAILILLVWGTQAIIKNQISFQEAASIVAVRSILLSPLYAISIILTLIQPFLGLSVFFMAGFATIIILGMVMPCYRKECRNLVPWMLIIAVFVFIIIELLFLRQGVKLYIPSMISQRFGQLNNYFSLGSQNSVWTETFKNIFR